MRKHLLCIVLLMLTLTWLTTGAQTNTVDSLAQLIDHHTANDTVKASLMTSLAENLAYSDPNRAMKLVDVELPMAQQLHYQKGILSGYNDKTSLLFLTGNLQQALTVGEEFLRTAGQFHSQPSAMTANSLLGIIYSQNGNYPKALEYMLASLKIAEQIKAQFRIPALDQNIGNVYNDMEDYDKAIDYYKNAITITQTLTPPTPVPPSLYNNIGSVLIRQKKYTDAIDYLEKGRQISQQMNNRRSLAGALTNLSDAWHNLGDDEKSYEYGRQALAISRVLGDKRSIANAMINVGTSINDVSDKTLTDQHIDPKDRSTLSIASLDSAILLASAIGDLATEEEAYRELSAISEKQKNYPLAMSSLRMYIHLHDTIVNNDNEKSIMRKFIQYDFDKKAAEIQLQQQITEARLKEQQLLSHEAAQELKINQNELSLSNKDRDLEKLAAQKEQVELTKEEQEKRNIQVLADQKDKIHALEIASQRRLRYGLIAGLLLIGVIGILVYLQSTMRKAANQRLTLINGQLDEANRVKARFLGIISHDLRSPVANLISLINLRKEAPDLLDEEGMVYGQQKITDTAENLLHAMEDILLWSKGQMVTFKPHIKTLSIQSVFTEMQLLYTGNGHVRILFSNPQNLQINTDEDYLKTILRNLTSNAIKAVDGRPDALVEWKAWRDNQQLACLSITDNGPGISTTQRAALFNNEADIGIKNGLGLPLVRDFATAVKCTIEVSAAVGGGTTFLLQFREYNN
jgi:signal transduction histidine kinase